MSQSKLTKPPFSYYGGKQRMASKIVPLLPPHTVYVEPFCGSGAVMFKKGLPDISNTNHYREVINDQNELIVNFFRVLQDKQAHDELLHRLRWTVYSQDEYKRATAVCREPDGQDAVTLAWAWFVAVNCAYNKVLFGGLQYGTIGRNNPPTHYNAVERLRLYRDRLKYCFVFNEDALNIIKRFDAPHTCFYVDPPYPGANQGHYGGYTQEDFQALIDTLKTCKGSVVLSCYNNAAVPSDWVKHEFKSVAVASSKGVTGKNRNTLEAPKRNADRVECVWIKPHDEMRPELYLQALKNKETLGKG